MEEHNAEVMNLREAAEFLRVSEKTVGDLARAATIPCQKVGREWRFLRTAIVSWLAQEDSTQRVAEPEVQYMLPLPTETRKALEHPAKPKGVGFGDTAFTSNRNLPLHRWVPWIAGFSSSFVANVLEAASEREPSEVTVLDPFAGVGTTLVEALRLGHNAIGFDINPYAALACRVKVQCSRYDLELLEQMVQDFRSFMRSRARSTPASVPPPGFVSRSPFFSPKVERKVLHVLDFIGDQTEEWVGDVLRVAFGAVMVGFSNYSYEPSLGRRVSAGKENILDADVAAVVTAKLRQMVTDIAQLQLQLSSMDREPSATIIGESFLDHSGHVAPKSVDFLITSPPYLNNYHYIRNTRPHLFWLGLVESTKGLKGMEQANFGKYWQTVRTGPELTLDFECDELTELLADLRSRNEEKGAYGGSGWANYAVSYFNDCLKFSQAAHGVMKPGGSAVVVIGNNILQGLEFKTDEIFARIAERCGFEIVQIHRVRKKRTGSSIVNSGVRAGKTKKRVELYETAVELKASARKGKRAATKAR